MKVLSPKLNEGQSLVEVLVALGIFVTGTAAIGLLVFDAEISARQGVERTQAVLFAEEGIEAARSIRDADFDNLVAGDHGLLLSGNTWSFSGMSDTKDQFTRQVRIADVDIDTKKVQSIVNWQFTKVRPSSITLSDYLTDWNQTQGKAGENFVVDISGARVSSAEIQGINIKNNGSSPIIIDKISVSWGSTAYLISNIYIGSNLVWGGGTGSPSGNQPTGTVLDIADFSLDAGVTMTIRFVFTQEIDNDRFIIKFMAGDSSTKYTLVDFQGGAANDLAIDLSQAVVVNNELRGVRLRNNGELNLILDQATITWTSSSRKITNIVIGGIQVWSGSQTSGSQLDIGNYTLIPSPNWIAIDYFRFSKTISNNTFNITFTMGNGSASSTGNFSR